MRTGEAASAADADVVEHREGTTVSESGGDAMVDATPPQQVVAPAAPASLTKRRRRCSMPSPMPPPFNTEAYDKIDENRFRRVTDDPLSTFSIDVDTASYANVGRS